MLNVVLTDYVSNENGSRVRDPNPNPNPITVLK